ncbi:MAG TPA: Bax inhibitor-1/YccA family protein [Alphaproteobacteria bacterium]|jgi:FtsH-binding integral membrane protein|nr:Bax inhibitor-1/YccA family protein [Alphaproteobacteria bacterium]
MSQDPYQTHVQTRAAAGSDIDAGLQSFMRGVYNTMAIGLGVTGVVAFGFAQMMLGNPALMKTVLGGPLAFVLMAAPLIFIFGGFTQNRIARWPASKLQTMFYVFAAVMGLSMSVIFIAFSAESIARVFFITAGTFAAVSLYGYTTKRDLSGMGSFMFMGMIGLFLAMIVNLFLQSEMVHFVVSIIGVMVFTGLAAWQTQALKETYAYGRTEDNGKLAVMGALGLYLSFINLFQFLLNLMGNRE